MAKRKDGASFEVGYGRPPRQSQFKPGKSGNPRGRPKEAKTLDDVLRKRFFAKVAVRENGKSKTITVLEVIIGRLIKAAAEGDAKSIESALRLTLRLQTPGEAASKDEAGLQESDRLVLEEFARMLGDVGERSPNLKETDP